MNRKINDITPEEWNQQLPLSGLDSNVDNVNAPFHYNTGNIECIESIEASMSTEAFKGYLKGNCQKYLTPDPDHIHIRMRGLKENAMVFSHYYNKDEEIKTGIPRRILEIWREDIGESDKPKIKTCASACFLSLHTKHRPFIEKWRDQMYEVLPDDNVGVVDHRSIAYFQTDESVLNSVLCFSETAPPPTESYKLDKDPNAFFVHFVNHPKPWQMWNSYTASHFDKTVAIMEWAIDNGIKPPTLIPFSFSRKFRMVNLMLAPFGKTYSRIMKFLDSLE